MSGPTRIVSTLNRPDHVGIPLPSSKRPLDRSANFIAADDDLVTYVTEWTVLARSSVTVHHGSPLAADNAFYSLNYQNTSPAFGSNADVDFGASTRTAITL